MSSESLEILAPVRTPVTWRLRDVVPEDRPFLENLYGEAFPIKYDNEFYTSLIKKSYKRTPLFTRVCVDEKLGRLGSVTCRVKSCADVPPLRNGSVLYVMTMAVAPSARRTRTGTRLMHSVLHFATYDDPHVEAIYLHVLVSNDTAIRFYESLGFVRQKLMKDFYTFDDDTHDAYLYVARLTSKAQVVRLPPSSSPVVGKSSSNVFTRVWSWIKEVFWTTDDDVDEDDVAEASTLV